MSASATPVADVGAGAWLHNPATGEIARIRRSDGRRMEVDLWLHPGAALAREHVHDRFAERFEVLAGEVAMRLAGAERVARPGDGVVDVPAGTLHDWWNAGTGVARVRVEVEAAPTAPGRPAARFVAMIEAMWSLGALGHVNGHGVPKPLWLAAVAREFRDVIRFPGLAGALLAPVAAMARRTGHDPLAPELHGPGAACALPDPGEAGLAEMLARPVSARRR